MAIDKEEMKTRRKLQSKIQKMLERVLWRQIKKRRQVELVLELRLVHQ